MNYYKYKNKYLFSLGEYPFEKIRIEDFDFNSKPIFFLNSMEIKKSRRSFVVNSPELLFINCEDLNLIKEENKALQNIDKRIIKAIEEKRVVSLNTFYNSYLDILENNFPKKWRINIVGLGDVGGTLLSGLRLLGGECISEIGIFDLDEKKINRWLYEANAITAPLEYNNHPAVVEKKIDELFDCDAFVFCVSMSVPEVGRENGDVRMAQFKGNSKIITYYANEAVKKRYRGQFFVVSDPVDLLSMKVYENSKDFDSEGNVIYSLPPDNIRGFGLGVMNGRACYFSSLREDTKHYINEGRAYGPHGEGLIIADSIKNYDHEKSLYLTELTLKANLKVREVGFKPYVAPALSSGALSILYAIQGKWHYSSTLIGEVFMGALNRMTPYGTEIERHDFNETLYGRLKSTYRRLLELYE